MPASTHYEITEEGVEGWHLSGIVSDDALDADDNDSNKGSGVISANKTDHVTVTNNKATVGALKLKKLVKVDGNELTVDNSDPVRGRTYHFTVVGPAGDASITRYVLAEARGGRDEVANVFKYYASTTDHGYDAGDWYSAVDPNKTTGDGPELTLDNLEPGRYTITEDTVIGNMITTVSDGTATTESKTITVDVTPGTTPLAEVTFTNNVQTGSLKLKKLVVDENGDEISDKRANGKYTFEIVGPDPSDEVAATVTIVVENGKATKYNLTGERDNYGDLVFVSLPDDDYVSIPDLATGTYTVTETKCDMTTWKHKYEAAPFQVRVNDNSAQLTGGDSVTVTVTADDPTTTDVVESTTVDFTNKVTLIPGALTVQKIWQDENGNPTQGNAAWEGVEKVYVSVTRVKNPNGNGSHEETVLSIDGKTELEITSQGKHYTLTQVGDDPDSNEYTASADDTDKPWSIELENLNLCGSDEYYDGYIVKEIRVVRTDDSTEVPYVGFITTYSPTKDGEISRATIANPQASVNHEATIANKKVTTATLRLKKKLIADSSEPANSDSSKTNGTYTFTVVGPTGAVTTTRKYVIIKTVNGAATSYKMGDMDSSWTEADIPTWDTATATEQPVGTDEYVTLEGLVPGKYTVKEVDWKLDTTDEEFLKKAAMTLFDILVPAHEGNTVDISTRTATVWVGQGEAQTVDMTYENKLIPIEPTVKKMVIDINDSSESHDPSYSTEHISNDSADHDIGDDVPYRITTTLPGEYYRSADTTKYYYELHDEMTHLQLKEWNMYAFVKTDEAVNGQIGKWYDVSDSFEIKSNSTSNDVQTITVGPKNTDFDLLQVNSGKLVINWGKSKANTHAYVYPYDEPSPADSATGFNPRDIRYLQFRYTATLTKDANIGSQGNPNDTWLTYENGTADHGTSKKDRNKVFTYRLAFNKQDDQGNNLSGAKFELYKKYLPKNQGNAGDIEGYFGSGTSVWVYRTYKDNNGNTVRLYGPEADLPADMGLEVTDTTPVYTRVRRISNSEYKFVWNGIDDGEYLLVETEAPKGYKALTEPIAISITAGYEWDAADPQMTSFNCNTSKDKDEWFTVHKTETTIDGKKVVTVEDNSVTGAISNTPYPGIKIVKIDWDTRTNTHPTYLQGAVFTIRKWDSSSYQPYIRAGATDATVTTDEQGVAIIDKLEPGEYWIQETGVPIGYARPNNDI